MITFRVTNYQYDETGTTRGVTADSRDVLVWERGCKGRSFGKMADELTMGDMYELAFIACRRQKIFEFGARTDFEYYCTVDVDPSQEEPAPFPPTP